ERQRHARMLGAIRLLYVEDDPHYVAQFQPILKDAFGTSNLVGAATASKALQVLTRSDPPNALAADLFIPAGPAYKPPPAAVGLPRTGDFFDFGVHVCTVALELGIPIVALSVAPAWHPARRAIEWARKRYGGRVRHLDRAYLPEPQALV